jgi:hypothetical protein
MLEKALAAQRAPKGCTPALASGDGTRPRQLAHGSCKPVASAIRLTHFAEKFGPTCLARGSGTFCSETDPPSMLELVPQARRAEIFPAGFVSSHGTA